MSAEAQYTAAVLGTAPVADLLIQATGKKATERQASLTGEAFTQAADTMSGMRVTFDRLAALQADVRRLDQQWRPWRAAKRPVEALVEDFIEVWQQMDFDTARLQAFTDALGEAGDEVAQDSRLLSEAAVLLRCGQGVLGVERSQQVERRQGRLVESQVAASQAAVSLGMVLEQAHAVCASVSEALSALLARAETDGVDLPQEVVSRASVVAARGSLTRGEA